MHNLFRPVLKEGEFFWQIFGKYCPGARRRISSNRFLKGDFLLKNFRNLLENIVGVQDDESLLTGSEGANCFRKFSEIIGKYCRCARGRISSKRILKGEFFWKFSEIIGKYCRGARRRISSNMFLKCEFFSKHFGKFWKILSGCKMTNLL
jgi:hypothetical protein